MTRIGKTILPCLVIVLLLNGCWDQEELNHQLFELAGGVDVYGQDNSDNRYLLSTQLLIPAKIGEGGIGTHPSFVVQTSIGKNIFDGIQNMQHYLSRTLKRGHRRNVFIGEALARRGISELFDSFTRDPDSRLRTDVWVVKDATALELMTTPYPFERIPATAPIKIHEAAGGEVGTSLVDYLMAASGEGSYPTLPVVKIISTPGLKKPTIEFYGRAIFNREHKLIGYLDYDEAHYRAWIIGITNNAHITTKIPDIPGVVSVLITQTKSKIRCTLLSNGNMKIEIILKGQVIVKGNDTTLDLSDKDNLMLLEQTINQEIRKKMQRLMYKIQKDYKTDILGIGQAINRKYPRYWNRNKSEWDSIFVNANISVTPKIIIKRIGLQGQPLHEK